MHQYISGGKLPFSAHALSNCRIWSKHLIVNSLLPFRPAISQGLYRETQGRFRPFWLALTWRYLSLHVLFIYLEFYLREKGVSDRFIFSFRRLYCVQGVLPQFPRRSRCSRCYHTLKGFSCALANARKHLWIEREWCIYISVIPWCVKATQDYFSSAARQEELLHQATTTFFLIQPALSQDSGYDRVSFLCIESSYQSATPMPAFQPLSNLDWVSVNHRGI